MNIKEFLIDNYIWILVIILITIITIIGFLADKKKTSKKTENVPTQNPNYVNNQPVNNMMGEMQYNGLNQQIPNQMNNNMNMGINTNEMNNMVTQPLNDNFQNQQNLGNFNNNLNSVVTEQPMQMNFQANAGANNNNPIPVENIVQNTTSESIYQPLSEQKPLIAPHPAPTFSNIQNNQLMNNAQVENVQSTIPQVSAPTYEQQSIHQMAQPSFVPETKIIQPNNYQNSTQQPDLSNSNLGNIPNFNQTNTTIPEPINNNVSIPQPVRPQSIMQETYNNQSMMQNNYGQINQPQTMNQPTQQPSTQPTTSAPINFVYGPQQNNQNM